MTDGKRCDGAGLEATRSQLFDNFSGGRRLMLFHKGKRENAISPV